MSRRACALALGFISVATAVVADVPVSAAAVGSGAGAAALAEPEPLEVDRSQDRLDEVLEAEAESAADLEEERVDLPAGAMDGAADVPASGGLEELHDTDGDGVVAPPVPEAPETTVTAVEAGDPTAEWLAGEDPAPGDPAPGDPGGEEPVDGAPGPGEPSEEAGELVEEALAVDFDALEPGDEVVEMRTEESRTFVEEGGQLRTEIGSQPMFVEDDEGELVVPDASPQEGDDGRWRPEVGREGVSFAPEADAGTLVAVSFGEGRRIAWELEGAASVAPVPDGDMLRYPEVFPGVDLELQATTTGMKEVIVLDDADAPTTYEFPLELEGLEAELEHPESSVELLDAETDELVAAIPSGTARDATLGSGGELLDPVPVAYELVEDGDATTLVVTVDEEWLGDPARQFPVRVDPSIVEAGPSGDAWINSASPNTNTGADTILKTGGGCSPSNANCQTVERRSAFVKWNLGLLSSAAILGAEYQALNIYSFSCQPRWFGMYRVAGAWEEGTLTWNNRPTYGPTVLGAHNVSHGHEGLGCGDAWVNTPMTNMVQQWVDGDYPNHGLTVRVATQDTGPGRCGRRSTRSHPGPTSSNGRWSTSAPARGGSTSRVCIRI